MEPPRNKCSRLYEGLQIDLEFSGLRRWLAYSKCTSTVARLCEFDATNQRCSEAVLVSSDKGPFDEKC